MNTMDADGDGKADDDEVRSVQKKVAMAKKEAASMGNR